MKKMNVFACFSFVLMFFPLMSFVMSAPSLAQTRAIPDQEIIEAVNLDLFHDDVVSAHLIDVTSIDGVVTLTGSVDHLYAKSRAEEIVQSIKGVRSVINRLTVKPVFRPDAEIARDRKSVV